MARVGFAIKSKCADALALASNDLDLKARMFLPQAKSEDNPKKCFAMGPPIQPANEKSFSGHPQFSNRDNMQKQ
jgi:hypothetical protein